MRIRPISDSYLPGLLEVYRQSEDFLALGPNPHASLEMIAADQALSREQGGEFCGLFDDDGVLMGVFDFIRAGFEGDPACGFIELLMIAAPYRNRGLGAAAVAWLENELRLTPGGYTLAAGVQVNNPAAIRFWQRLGFRIISPAEPLPDGTVAYRLKRQISYFKIQ